MTPAIKHYRTTVNDGLGLIARGLWYTDEAEAIESGQAALDVNLGAWFTIETRWYTPHADT